MNFQVRLAAIVAAAVMTAALHHRYLASHGENREFVAAARAIKLGARPTGNDIQPILLAGDLATLSKVLIPWDERTMFIGSPVLREYGANELLVRRDVEASAITPYQPLANEYVFTVDLPESSGLKNSFQIGSPIGFLVQKPGGDSSNTTVEECGPFMLRQIGPVSRQLDQRLLQQIPSGTVTLSLHATEDGSRPAQAQVLLNALSGQAGWRIIGFYKPSART
jgi:hypothetical protein